ncbi:SDR family oxidoreductase [Candidatus Pelagibacter sp. FZCC0015]|uniref:SDR family oxidoreductase n=1 Tax=Candidatus Pelagibacter sp. FZCC0015 TaxID=2268451 RepID=UPI00119F8181|nr:SDR family oxidoreductase [Candidatus Pelagibacter sp. FZCC0015]
MNKKKVLIVGGSSGLGIHITKLYLNKNYSVTSISRKVNSKIKKKVRQISCDISDLEKLKEVLENLKKNKIFFDIIIHNVGGSQKIYNHDVDYKSYEFVWKSNIGYVVEINKHFIPYMQKKKWGRIVHVSSSAAYNYVAPSPYSSAKSALNTYVSSISRRLIKDKIVVSCVCPGPIELPKRYMTISQKKNNSFWKNYKKNHLPIGRLAKPVEITSVIYFLTSKVASYCSGAIWNVDGSEY